MALPPLRLRSCGCPRARGGSPRGWHAGARPRSGLPAAAAPGAHRREHVRRRADDPRRLLPAGSPSAAYLSPERRRTRSRTRRRRASARLALRRGLPRLPVRRAYDRPARPAAGARRAAPPGPRSRALPRAASGRGAPCELEARATRRLARRIRRGGGRLGSMWLTRWLGRAVATARTVPRRALRAGRPAPGRIGR